LGSNPFIRVEGEMTGSMAQRPRVAKEISPDKFHRLMDATLREDRELLELLAKV